jgi:ATP-binding cassette subfamily F protein uup
MNYLSVQDLGKSYGIQTLFKGLNFGIDQGQKVALVARNGTGKTTILRALADLEPADTGLVVWRKDLRIAFLQQESDFGDAKTVFQAIYESDNPLLAAIQECRCFSKSIRFNGSIAGLGLRGESKNHLV